MHVAGVNLFKYPARMHERKFMAEFGDVYRSTAELRKPFAHRVSHGLLGRFGPLYWEEDPDIDLDYHVRRSALPKPGGHRELFALVSQLHSALLDRSRPLWEVHVIEGMRNRALHHVELVRKEGGHQIAVRVISDNQIGPPRKLTDKLRRAIIGKGLQIRPDLETGNPFLQNIAAGILEGNSQDPTVLRLEYLLQLLITGGVLRLGNQVLARDL